MYVILMKQFAIGGCDLTYLSASATDDGSMNSKEREASLTRFKEDESVKVLLLSFKCGSLGLNLTVANRIIMLDIWWNPALEDQAIDRVHR